MNINTNHFTAPSHKDSFLFSFEGIEGSGKSTQIRIFKEYLESKNYQVLLLREPGGTEFGEGLRSQILNSKVAIDPIAEAYLFASSRAQLLREKVIPFLEQDKSIVILDRFFDSSLAYQGMARGLGPETIIDIHKYAPLNIMPNMTFYLRIDLETSMERQRARGAEKDYFEKENHEFYTKLIAGYDYAANEFSNRVQVVAADKPIDYVKKQICNFADQII